MKNVYCIFDDENNLLFISHDEELAQEMILALTEEFIYHSFLREADKSGIDTAMFLFTSARKYGWNKFQYETRRMIYE